MIKGIPPTSDKKTTQASSKQPDASTVSQEASQEFSSLLHKKGKKEQPVLSKHSKSKPHTKKSSDKTAAEQLKQVSKATKNKDTEQHPTANRQSDKSKSSAAAGKDDLPQSLDTFDIAAIVAKSQPLQQDIAPTVQNTQPPPADINNVASEIANRILVSTPDNNPAGGQEIRIQLKESVLPNTEVRIYRHAGRLQVEFITSSQDSQMLIQQKQSDIQKLLGERLTSENVQVSVQDSRQTRGGQGEGRSRQQYVYPSQDDENK
ncbi:MAG: hypothetical protein GDA45_01965 [Chromatiales bacterium]|nr:hypothetical protein [Chromatiales bacterium]